MHTFQYARFIPGFFYAIHRNFSRSLSTTTPLLWAVLYKQVEQYYPNILDSTTQVTWAILPEAMEIFQLQLALSMAH